MFSTVLKISNFMFFNSPGVAVAKPMGVLDLQYGSLDVGLNTPQTPPEGPQGRACPPSMSLTAPLGGSFCDHFIASILSSVLDSFWIRFGLVLGSFWDPFGTPNRQVGSKMRLEASLFENADLHVVVVKPIQKNNCFRPQDGPKIASRPVQDGSKRDKKVMHFSS